MTVGNKSLDAIIAVLAFCVGHIANDSIMPDGYPKLSTIEFFTFIPVVASTSWLVFEWLGIITQYTRPSFSHQVVLDDVKNATAITAFLVILVFIFKVHDFGRFLAVMFFICNFGIRFIVRNLIHRTNIPWLKETNYRTRNILIIGSKHRAQEIIHLVRSKYDKDYKIIGCLEVDPMMVGQEVSDGVNVIGLTENLEDILKKEVVDELLFAMPLRRIPNAEGFMVLAEEVGALVRILPDWQIYSLSYRPRVASLVFEPFMGVPTMALMSTLRGHFALMVKETIDYIIALTVIVALSPVFLGIALAIKIFSKGPILFKQERCGLNGRHFKMFKFRTMIENAEQMHESLMKLNEADGPVFKIEDDPRIIPKLGHFLRRTSLDELPQFFNILVGQMSFVGPRPPIPGEVVRYEVPQLRRLSVKPGITGLWQCMPARNKINFETWVKKDLEYIDNWSLWLDLKIIIRTLFVVLGRQGQ